MSSNNKKGESTWKDTVLKVIISAAGAIIPPVIMVVFDSNNKAIYFIVVLVAIFVGFGFNQLSIFLEKNEVESRTNEELINLKSDNERLSREVEGLKVYLDTKNIKTECLCVINDIQLLIENGHSIESIRRYTIYLSKKINESDYFNLKLDGYLVFVKTTSDYNKYTGFNKETKEYLNEYIKNVGSNDFEVTKYKLGRYHVDVS
ncbi:hypothetical protein ACTMLF_12385 [Proteus mirabilis]|uniref:hypothetical protein n=1 Tax=Proteus mirabilis TaxID=584 RepID=UPI003F89C77E|nr:hypothetical protein [Proteus mirabilis]